MRLRRKLKGYRRVSPGEEALNELCIEPYERWGLKRAYVVYVGRFIADSLRIVQVEEV